MFSVNVKLGALALTFDAEEYAQLARICRSASIHEDPGAYHFMRIFELCTYLISFANELPLPVFDKLLKHVGDMLQDPVKEPAAEA